MPAARAAAAVARPLYQSGQQNQAGQIRKRGEGGLAVESLGCTTYGAVVVQHLLSLRASALDVATGLGGSTSTTTRTRRHYKCGKMGRFSSSFGDVPDWTAESVKK